MEKTLIVFACLCSIALAQSRGQYSGQYNSKSSQYETSNSAYQTQQQYQQLDKTRSSECNELNERYPVPGSCDRYVECINGTAEEKLCPDGLRYNPNVLITSYPCQYPNEVTCLERSSLQPPQPTDQCPNQFGYFKLGDERNCSYFRTCVNGVGYDIQCPDGLAWSSLSYRCEWPDEVTDCDVEAFLGFRCPEIPESRELGAPAGYRFYRANDNCQKYFICIEQKPRVLFCGSDSAFDELTSTCISADEVDACPVELRNAAAKAREDEKQRLAKELEFDAITTNKRRQYY